MGKSEGSQSRPGYTRPGGDILGQGKLPFDLSDPNALRGYLGYLGDIQGGQGDFPIEQLFQGLGPLTGQSIQAGQDIYGRVSPGLDQAGQLFGAGSQGMMQGANLNQALLGMSPGLFAQGMQDAGGVRGALSGIQSGLHTSAGMLGGAYNTAAQQFGNAYGGANQILQNVMNPAAYNPMFQNQYQNQVLPNLRASYSDRGLVGGGSAIQGESEALQNMSNQYGLQQFGEQLQASGNLGNIAGMGASALGNIGQAYGQNIGNLDSIYGNLSLGLGAFPGQALNQFMGAGAQGMQGYGQMMQQSGGGLQNLLTGAAGYGAGVNLPFNTASNLYGLTRSPLEAYGNFINSVPTIGKQTQSGLISGLF